MNAAVLKEIELRKKDGDPRSQGVMTLWALQWAEDNGIEDFMGSEDWWRKLFKRNKQKKKTKYPSMYVEK